MRCFRSVAVVFVISAALGASIETSGDDRPPAGPARREIAVDAYRDAAARILEDARGCKAYEHLAELCDDVGHRLSGSPSLDRAIEWAIATLEKDGHENVRAEEVKVPKWVRGQESLEMLEPRAHPIVLLGLGGSVGTPAEGVTGEVVVVRSEAELDALGPDGAKGKVVLFDVAMPAFDPEKGSGYGETVRFRVNGARLAAARGAVACLVRSVTARSLRTPHTGGMRYGDAVRKIPAAAISTEDAGLIARLAARGKKVTVRLRMEARDDGLVPSANVVAELRGREAPDEVVVIGGHIDSWDVGQGAHDDGAGCVIAMEALSLLRRLNLVPRRTVRVVLFTNEENGLAGAKAYAAAHAAELARHVAAIESDSGGFAPTGFSVDLEDEAKEPLALADLTSILGLLAPIGATRARAGSSGADVEPLQPAGVAGLGLSVEGSRYFDYHHTPADTFDKIDRDELHRCVGAMAVVAYVLAEMPGRLGDSR